MRAPASATRATSPLGTGIPTAELDFLLDVVLPFGVAVPLGVVANRRCNQLRRVAELTAQDTSLNLRLRLVGEPNENIFGCRSYIYNGVNNLQAHYRWYVTDCF